MSTRKIRLSQNLTLKFRDISMPDADGNSTDEGNSDETFDSLPDLLPYIFQSQAKTSAPDLPYLVTDCSTYKLWEPCTTDVCPLASQSEAVHWLLTGTHIASTDNLHFNDGDSVSAATRIGARENLRRVQAFSPHTSILYAEKDVPPSEDLQIAHPDVICDAAIEFDSLDNDGDSKGFCTDSYLILDEDMTNEPPFHESIVAAATVENSSFSSVSEAPDAQKEHVVKHPEVKKRTQRRKSLCQASKWLQDNSSDFPKEFRKQKRSTPRRRGPSASIALVNKMNWLSESRQDHLESAQGAQVNTNQPEKEDKDTSQTRKTKRKTVSVSSARKLVNEPAADQSLKLQPNGRRGEKETNHSDHQPDWKAKNDPVAGAGKCT